MSIVALIVLGLTSSGGFRRARAQGSQKAPPAERTVAVRAARLVDVRRGLLVPRPVVLVTGGRITDVGTDLPVPATARVIDLGDVTLLPGLIDTHTHLLVQHRGGSAGGDEANALETVATMSTAARALRGAGLARSVLEAGITTVRDLGNSGRGGDVALRDAIAAGSVIGPRVRAATRALAPTGGQFGRLTPAAQSLIDEEYSVIAGADDARRAVRQAIYDGANWIKVIVNSGRIIMTAAELSAIVDEATRAGVPVAAHATTEEAAWQAVTAGVSSVEHGYALSDSLLRRMAQRRVFLVPTDLPAAIYAAFAEPGPSTPEIARARLGRWEAFVRPRRERLARAVRFGVPVAFGSDLYYAVPSLTRGQGQLTALDAYREAGMSPAQILRAATLDAAELLGWHDRIGVVEVGKIADLIAVSGDPLTDVAALHQVHFVMQEGRVVRNDLLEREEGDVQSKKQNRPEPPPGGRDR